jgi:sodium/bile acid cotransporter 7
VRLPARSGPADNGDELLNLIPPARSLRPATSERSLLKQLRHQWFLLVLVLVLVTGYLAATPLEPFSRAKWLQQVIVACTLFLMSLPLGLTAMAKAVRNPLPALLAVAMNALVAPLTAWGLAAPLALLSPEMATGLLLVGPIPTTLASAAVWTRRAGGNDAVALIVTILTNLGCFIVMPFWLLVTTRQDVDMDFAGMAFDLLKLVVLPIAAAQLLRAYRPVGQWATQQKSSLGVLAQFGILSMVGISAVHAGLKLDSDPWKLFGLDKAAMTLCVIAMHLAVLAAGFWTARSLRQAREDAIAVGFAGSQKTLMIGLHVATTYFQGLVLVILPIIVYHVSQLLADTLIADALRRRTGDRSR